MKKYELGKRIKQCREEKGLTQEKLGNEIWLNKSTIQRYETGKIESIKLSIIHALAKVFDVDPLWLSLKTDERGKFIDKHSAFDTTNDTLEIEDQNIILLARHLQEVPIEDREFVIKNIENTIDVYLKAKGYKNEKI